MITDGFDSPVGDESERRSASVLPGRWIDANPYGTFYNVTPDRKAFHTGADLNLPEDRDAHAPVYAVANGTVTYARKGGGTWGNLIVLRHDMPNGNTVYSRYGHVETMLIREGQAVRRGEQIATIGNAFGQFPFHLHFDLSTTNTLDRNAEDWPGTDEARLKRDYVPPLAFIRSNRPTMQPQQPPTITPSDMLRAAFTALAQANSALIQLSAALALSTPPTNAQQAMINSDIGLNARNAPNLKGVIMAKIPNGERLMVVEAGQADGYDWSKITEGQYGGWFVARQFLTFEVVAPVVDDPAAMG